MFSRVHQVKLVEDSLEVVWSLYPQDADTQPGPQQTSKIESFAKIVNGF